MEKIELDEGKRIRNKRSLNFIGSGIKWIAGTPDHDDLIKIHEKINILITNSNNLKYNNDRMTKIIQDINNGTTNTYILKTIIEELKNVLLTITMAKGRQINTLALNLYEIKNLIEIEKTELPIIDILEYSSVSLCRIKNSIILIIKYPIIKTRCNHFKITPLEFRHGKLQLDEQVSKCEGKFQRTANCMQILNANICKKQLEDECTLPVIQNKNNAKCVVKQEENEPLQIINPGHIIISGKHIVNNEEITGIKLINFENNVTIDKILYTNLEKIIKEYYLSHQNERFEIIKIMETEKQDLKFKKLKALRKFTIPFEEHPLRTTLIIILCFIIIFTLFWITQKILKICTKYYEIKTKKQYIQTLHKEIEKQQKINEMVLTDEK